MRCKTTVILEQGQCLFHSNLQNQYNELPPPTQTTTTTTTEPTQNKQTNKHKIILKTTYTHKEKQNTKSKQQTEE